MSLLRSGSALTTGDTEDTGRVTASCPSSPTETECSSGQQSVMLYFCAKLISSYFRLLHPPPAECQRDGKSETKS